MGILPQNGRACDCSEGKVEDATGQVVPTGLHSHSCAYVRLRNSLIPQAESFANSTVSLEERGGRLWARAFSQHMAKLMREPQNGGGADDGSLN
jgi:hypothetical protein